MSAAKRDWPPSLLASAIGESGLPNLGADPHYEATTTRQTETNVSAPISGRSAARPTLMVVAGADAGRVVRVTGDHVLIGRASTCDVVLPDPGVSRTHARLVLESSRYVVEDLGSKNGTFLDGDKITKQGIAYGQTIQIGPHVLIRFDMLSTVEESLSRQLYESSMRDPLTKTYNRRHLVERLLAEIAFAMRHGTELSLVMFDFDHFKRVNDTHGHGAGDAVLKEGTQRVSSALRVEDVLARIGGEEFAVALRGIGADNAVACAERVRAAIASCPILHDGVSIAATASFGVATLSECDKPVTPDQLFTLADRRLYEAKRLGRNRVVGPVARRGLSSIE